MENDSGAATSHAVEQISKEMEQKVIELMGRLKVKDEVCSLSFCFGLSLFLFFVINFSHS